MAQYGSQGQMRQTDEYGNPVQESQGMGGVYGSHQGGGMGMGAGTGGMGMGAGTGGMGKEHIHHQEGQQQLRRSDSSSSSEDDGQGGRRKKGIKEKITEKLPGHEHKEGEQHQQYGRATHMTETEGGEKKGMMDKIKDKIPGMH